MGYEQNDLKVCFDSSAHIGKASANAVMQREALIVQDRFHWLQFELRGYALICRTRFNDASFDNAARDLADKEVEDAVLQFNIRSTQ